MDRQNPTISRMLHQEKAKEMTRAADEARRAKKASMQETEEQRRELEKRDQKKG